MGQHKWDTHAASAKLQNFAAKVAAGGYKRRDRATPVLQELNWIRMKEKVNFDQCVMVYKVTYRYYPEWLLNLPYVTQSNELVSRQNRDLFIPRVRTDNGARSSKWIKSMEQAPP